MSLFNRIKADFEEAKAKGDAKKHDTLKELFEALQRNARESHPKPEREVLERIYNEIEKMLSGYEDYVTPDHAKARSNYKNDLTIIEEYLRS